MGNITYVGTFERYTPGPDAPALYRVMSEQGAVFHRNEDGVDWYEFARQQAAGGLYIAVDENDVFVTAGFTPDAFCPPEGRRVYLMRPAPDGWGVGRVLAEYSGRLFSPETGIGELYIRPTPTPAVSRRQFFQQAAVSGDITEAEALAAVQTGVIPAAFEAFIDTLPEPERFGARMMMSGAAEFDPGHALSLGYAAANGWSEDDFEQFFRAAALL